MSYTKPPMEKEVPRVKVLEVILEDGQRAYLRLSSPYNPLFTCYFISFVLTK